MSGDGQADHSIQHGRGAGRRRVRQKRPGPAAGPLLQFAGQGHENLPAGAAWMRSSGRRR